MGASEKMYGVRKRSDHLNRMRDSLTAPWSRAMAARKAKADVAVAVSPTSEQTRSTMPSCRRHFPNRSLHMRIIPFSATYSHHSNFSAALIRDRSLKEDKWSVCMRFTLAW
jgi:hypothetical protein